MRREQCVPNSSTTLAVLSLLALVSCISSQSVGCRSNVDLQQQTVLDKLCQQWQMQFDRYDVNNNGKLDISDIEYIKRRSIPFVDVYARDETTSFQTEMWKLLVGSEDFIHGPYKEDFMQRLADMYHNDKPALAAFWREVLGMDPHATLDFNRDDIVTEAEMLLSERVIGLTPSPEMSFLPLPVEELIDLWTKASTEAVADPGSQQTDSCQENPPTIGGSSTDSAGTKRNMRSRNDMTKRRQQWEALFDVHDIDSNGRLERSDLKEIKARLRPFLPEVARLLLSDLQNFYWEHLTNADNLDAELSKDDFVQMIFRLWRDEGEHEYEIFVDVVIRFLEQGFVDTDGNGDISDVEMSEAAYAFGKDSTVTDSRRTGRAHELMSQAVQNDIQYGEIVGDIVNALIFG